MKRVLLLLALFCCLVQMHAQYTISGIVKGTDSGGLTGANIVLKESYRGTTTDTDGKFKLSNLKPGGYIVVVSFIGYEPYEKEIQLYSDMFLEIQLDEAPLMGDEVIIRGTRAGNRTPSSFSNIDKDELEKTNLGHDLPVLLNRITSVVSTTDAGNGIGYTGMRIRGTDINRINVTINGIPFNDSESHSVYWVDLPDIVSSVDNIQIQRGVGTSSNGAAAFGATIDLQTSKLEPEPFAKAEFDYGSFNTLKANLSFGTGLLKDKFTLDGRLSKISSDGFIDRAWSDLKSFYVSGGYYTGKTIIRLYVFSGLEETYQAWNGVPKARLENDSAEMMNYIAGMSLTAGQAENLLNSGSRTYNIYTYPNQIDHYQQSHYQLHFSRQINKSMLFNSALHYTKGSGYYEEFKNNAKFASYGLNDFILGQDTVSTTDLIRRKWLVNDFYGFTSSLIIHKGLFSFIAGGGWNRYLGHHFGNLIWAQYAAGFEKNHEWYRSKGEKYDYNIYAKINYLLHAKLNLFTDVQYRGIRYDITGINDDGRDITMKGLDFDFFNPKFGLFYQINDLSNAYVSYSVAHREPNRSNYIDAPAGKIPTHEVLYDFELGYNLSLNNLRLSVNLYQMKYKNQLVLTGEINDVGDAIMVNVPNSYRRGIEATGSFKISSYINWNGNITLSTNKIREFAAYVDNWNYWDDPENQLLQYSENLGETDISFSPGLIAGSQINFMPSHGLSISLMSKYVGKQYIDNTSSEDRSLSPYFVNDLFINYKIGMNFIGEMIFKLAVNNILNEKYETNAWVYRYYFDQVHYSLDGYFPQAGTNVMAGITVKF